ncbi:MAG TPA: polysaccharide deacetylase family protein [Kofleriaceae bacterium]|nr:polysaccharide deacetylase family protein [Kofleriaceae bacterium]
MGARRLIWIVVLGAGCQQQLADVDGAFWSTNDPRRLHCAVNLDSEAQVDDASLDSGLDRALRRGEVVELYAHHPGATVPVDKVAYVLAGAQARGLSFFTYSDFANHAVPPGTPGIALSFDDTSVQAWVDQLPLFQQYGARITFFISHYNTLPDTARNELHTLADAGHDIEPHSVTHQRGPEYVEQHGMAAYLADEIQPSIDALSGEGFTLTSYAYPFGSRTDETDRALLERVSVLRSVAFTYEGDGSPCPF